MAEAKNIKTKKGGVLQPKDSGATKKRTVLFEGNGKSIHLGDKTHAVTPEEAKAFKAKGYGDIKK